MAICRAFIDAMTHHLGKVKKMAHHLDFTLGKAAIAYKASNGTPWHGYGEFIESGDSAADIVRKAGIDYSVIKAPLFYNAIINGESVMKDYENRAALYRSDTGDHLGIMSESHYVPAQPIDLVQGIMSLCDSGEFEIDVAGALKGGTVIWALLKRVGAEFDIGKGGFADLVNQYLLVTTSYNGTIARQGRFSEIRTVCNNTLTATLGEKSKAVAKQRNSAEFDLQRQESLFGKLAEHDKAFADMIERQKAMADIKISSDTLARYFGKIYAPKAFNNPDNWIKDKHFDFNRDGVTTNQKNTIAALIEAFQDSPGSDLPSANGTLWGALNAVTFYQDHAARTKEGKRWESATIGNGERVKNLAHETAFELLNA